MIPSDLRIQAFKSFDEQGSFHFGDSPGLFNIRGENLFQPKLKSNGCGKSSIIDAWCWVMFGKTLTGARAGNIHTWGSSRKTEVEYDFIGVDGKSHTIKRTWSPNKLLLDAVIVEQGVVEDILGFTFETFSYGVCLGQFSKQFFDMRSTEALDLLTEVMDLSKWDSYRDEAKAQTDAINDKIASKESLLSRLDGKLDALKETDYTADAEQWERELEQELDGIEEEFNTLEDLLTRQESDLELHSEVLVKMEKPELPKDKQSPSIKADIANLDGEIRGYGRQIASVEREIKRIQNLDSECPTCGAEVTADHKIEALRAPTAEKESLEEAVEKLKKKKSRLQARADKVEAAYKEAKILYDLDEENYRKAEGDRNESKRRVDTTNGTLDRLEEKHEYLVTSVNPYTGKIKEQKMKIRETKKQRKSLKKEIQELRSDLENTAYWVKGFKDIKLYLTSTMLTSLELEVNRSLMSLGMEDWTVSLVVEQETKSHTISRGFSVIVSGPSSEKPVPLDTLSGGEARRLKLAGTIGVMELIQSVGTRCDLLVMDEPSTHMNEEGVKDLMDTLKNFASENEKRIWVIDHSLPSYPYSGTVLVKRTEEGSHLEC